MAEVKVNPPLPDIKGKLQKVFNRHKRVLDGLKSHLAANVWQMTKEEEKIAKQEIQPFEQLLCDINDILRE